MFLFYYNSIQGISMLPRNVDQPNTSSHTKDHSVSQNQLSNNESAEKPNENTSNKSEDLGTFFYYFLFTKETS